MFDEASVRRMERMVLGALEWRTRSVTPLAFLGFFLSACYPAPHHPTQVAAVKARAVDLLVRAQPGTCAAHALPCQCHGMASQTKRYPSTSPPSVLLTLVAVPSAEVKMAEFSPSVSAAAALLAAAGEVAAANLQAFQAVVAACPFVNSVSIISPKPL